MGGLNTYRLWSDYYTGITQRPPITRTRLAVQNLMSFSSFFWVFTVCRDRVLWIPVIVGQDRIRPAPPIVSIPAQPDFCTTVGWTKRPSREYLGEPARNQNTTQRHKWQRNKNAKYKKILQINSMIKKLLQRLRCQQWCIAVIRLHGHISHQQIYWLAVWVVEKSWLRRQAIKSFWSVAASQHTDPGGTNDINLLIKSQIL